MGLARVSRLVCVFTRKGWKKEEGVSEIRGCLALEKLTGLSGNGGYAGV